MPVAELLKSTSNPVIQQSGSATFGKNNYCLWYTADGSTSSCTITNTGLANTLTIVVSGAPSSIVCTDGSPFNGQHTIPPNNPTMNITAVGNFAGTQVTIFNMSSLDTPCQVNVVVAS